MNAVLNIHPGKLTRMYLFSLVKLTAMHLYDIIMISFNNTLQRRVYMENKAMLEIKGYTKVYGEGKKAAEENKQDSFHNDYDLLMQK